MRHFSQKVKTTLVTKNSITLSRKKSESAKFGSKRVQNNPLGEFGKLKLIFEDFNVLGLIN